MISDLPLDLESEILSRVPATSLSQLRPTCKRWYALINAWKFVKKNLAMGKAAREVILLMNSRVHSISVNLHGIHNSVDPIVESTGKLNSPRDIKISNISHCDGLMLCSTEGNTRLVVWNPCTGEIMWIKPRLCYKYWDKYVLGYGNNNSSSHSYKILMFNGYHNGALDLLVAEYEVYDFSSDTWRFLDDATHNWYTCYMDVNLKGNGYGIAFYSETGYFMPKFDFTTERFGCLPLPYQSYDPEDNAVVLSVVREEQLSVLHLDFDAVDTLEMKIWVTNKIDEEAKEVFWSKFFVVDLEKFNLQNVFSVKSFLVNEEKKIVICTMYDEDKIYVVGEDIHKAVYKETTKRPMTNSPLLVSYVPSLVQIPKTMRNGKRKRNTRGG